MRKLSLFLVAALTLSVAGAAWAGTACDKEKASAANATVGTTEKASTKASATTTVKMASSHGGKECTAAEKAACTPAERAACEAKKAMASADADCPFCNFMAEYKAAHGKVNMSTVDSENGVTVVFAAVTKEDIITAQTMANKAYAMMNAPSHCSYTKAQMTEKSCDGCKEGLEAFSQATVSLENTETGAQAMVKVEKKEQVAKLHEFFANLGHEEKTQG